MKETTNIKINSELKKLFQSAEQMHRLTIGEAAEIGMRYVLVGLKQKTLIEQEIKRTELELLGATQKQNSLKLLLEQVNSIKIEITADKSNGNGSEELEALRDKMFSRNRDDKNWENLIKQWGENQGARWNWDGIVERFRFKDVAEARDWYRKKIEAEATLRSIS